MRRKCSISTAITLLRRFAKLGQNQYDVACRIQVEIGANRLRSTFNDPRNKPLARANARMRPGRTQTLGILVRRRPNIGRYYWSHSDLISFW